MYCNVVSEDNKTAIEYTDMRSAVCVVRQYTVGTHQQQSNNNITSSRETKRHLMTTTVNMCGYRLASNRLTAGD